MRFFRSVVSPMTNGTTASTTAFAPPPVRPCTVGPASGPAPRRVSGTREISLKAAPPPCGQTRRTGDTHKNEENRGYSQRGGRQECQSPSTVVARALRDPNQLSTVDDGIRGRRRETGLGPL